MKKRLVAIVASFSLLFSIVSATNMCVKQKNGEIVKYEVDNVEEVFFEEPESTSTDDPSVVDETDTPLKFEFLSATTVGVKWSYSYQDFESVTIPSKVKIGGTVYTVTSIGGNAFSTCNNLSNVEIPTTVTKIGFQAFEGCKKLTEIKIPNSVEKIENSAFKNTGLTSIEIPESVTSIDFWAFEECMGFTPGLLIYNSGKKCYGWVGDKNQCLELEIPEGVEEIGGSAFQDCNKLTKASLPEGLVLIDTFAFSRCNALTDINIPSSVETISVAAFVECYELRSMKIPESVTKIAEKAFYYCEELDLEIENKKENVNVEDDAFEGVKSVTYTK